jgi:hypothetical protein
VEYKALRKKMVRREGERREEMRKERGERREDRMREFIPPLFSYSVSNIYH